MKTCSKCGEIKEEDLFGFQNKSLGIKMSACKDCNNSRQRINRLNNLTETRLSDKVA